MPVTILSTWGTVAWRQLRPPGADLVAEHESLEITEGSMAREGLQRQQPSRAEARQLSPYFRNFKKQVTPDPQVPKPPREAGFAF